MLQENNTVKTIALINALVGTGKNGPNESKAPVITDDVAKSSVASFSDGADGMALKSCVVQINPVQTGEGDPAPDNIRPLFGATGCTISRTGKNLVQLSTNMVVARPWDSAKDALRVDLPPGTFTGRFNSETVHAYVYAELYDRSGTVRLTEESIKFSTTVGNGWLTKTFSVPDGGGRLYIYADQNNPSWTFADLIQRNFQLELGSTMSATYIPYTGQTYPISWQNTAGTVYGGTINPLTGVLTVSFLKQNLFGEGITVERKSTNTTGLGRFTVSGITGIVIAPNSQPSTLICNAYKTVSNNQTYAKNDGIGTYSSAGTVVIYDTNHNEDTADTFASYLESIGAYVVYPLITPLTYQLDPVEIKTLLGRNNIWADTGAVSVEYPADTKAYIDSATDPDGNVVTVTGSTPSITGESGKRYVCGTVDSISITPPQTGIIDVVFTSGTTPAVLTVPNTVRFPAWFDPSSLDASTTYEINIADGIYGAVMAWT